MLFGSGGTSTRRRRAHKHAISAALLFAGMALPASSLWAQTTSSAAPSIHLLIDGKAPIVPDDASLSALPPASVTAAAHHEASSTWRGVALEDVLRKAGVPSGEQLRGHAMTTIVRVSASDHYQVVFSLAELDPTLGNALVILATTQDGHPLTKDGPFRLIVPGDKRPARWIRNVTTIEVTSTTTLSPAR
jgi:hypothetical protein